MTFIFREVTTGNTSHGVRRLVEHAISLLNSLGPIGTWLNIVFNWTDKNLRTKNAQLF